MKEKRIDFLGCPVDNLTMGEVIQQIDFFIGSGWRHQIIPLNASKLFLMSRHPLLAQILKTSDLVVPEYAVVWGSRRLNKPLVEHIGGIMLMRTILEMAPLRGYKLYFLGARQPVVEQMVTRLKLSYPGLNIVGYHHGYFNDSVEGTVIADINASHPDILFVAMGTPKQEYWIHQYKTVLNVPVAIGVGGSFDVFAGLRKEAPSWMRHGFEWIYRLVQDPQNLWRRYLFTNLYFIYRVFVEKLRITCVNRDVKKMKARIVQRSKRQSPNHLRQKTTPSQISQFNGKNFLPQKQEFNYSQKSALF